MSEREEIIDLLRAIFEKEELIFATLSSPHKGNLISKIIVRPLQIKGKLSFQVTENRGQQAFHKNLDKKECLNLLLQHIDKFKQTFFYTKYVDYHILVGKKKNVTILKKPPTKSPQTLLHNRKKEYVLQEGDPIPFLISLGVMNAQGKVYSAKQDKFRQINRFLEMIDDVLDDFDSTQLLKVVDFGCGKAYLTFALYHYLSITKGFAVHMVGIDLKSEVIQYCQDLSKELGYQEHLDFIKGDIDHYQTKERVDLVVSLHACDTATDVALEKGIRWQAKVILSVPCCQHELLSQIQQEALRPLLKHGILKERFAALITDAARVQLLEVLGYQAQILEFIEVEHTPKNLLIRATRRNLSEEHRRIAWLNYMNFKNLLKITPFLELRFQKELEKIQSLNNLM